MANKLGWSLSSRREGRCDHLSRVQSQSFAAISLAVVHGSSEETSAKTVHSQFAMDAQGQRGHLQVERPLRRCNAKSYGKSFAKLTLKI